MAKVLIIGNGGREHALAWALSRSPQVDQVYVAPGNGGTQWDVTGSNGLDSGAPCANVAIASTDYPALIAFARDHMIDLTVVGPEVPLADGIVDRFQEAGLTIFGPKAACAQIEASKAFSKDFMTEQNIPTGEYFVTDEYDEARRFLNDYHKQVVIKASGLAAGKGVIVCDNQQEAGKALHQIMVDRIFGDAGELVIIEERLSGRELSVLAFCDGKTVKPMIIARDYKRALDGNKGLNTGGMGAVAPASDIPQALIDEITETALKPVLAGMEALGTPYVGILYAGVMMTPQGAKVLEYNCRFGDPETQVILPLLKTDLYTIMLACIHGTLANLAIEWHEGYCVTIVAASGGYPNDYAKGLPITGLDNISDGIVFHAGTTIQDGTLVTNGGRVMCITALGDQLDTALANAYQQIPVIHFDGMHFRKDIGAIYD